MSGKLGGIEVAQVGGRGVLKQAKLRQSSCSVARTTAQNFQAGVIAQWRGFDDAHRRRWNIAAAGRKEKDRLGVTRALSGFQLYMSMPHLTELFGHQAYWGVPPAFIYPGTFYVDADATSPHTLTLTVTGILWADPFAWNIQIGRMRPQNPDARCYNWKALRPYGGTFGTNQVGLLLTEKNIQLISGERIALKLVHYTIQYWPVEVDLGTITVGV
jgi:hypothetical protein